MNLLELYESGAYDPSEDKIAKRKMSDNRKPILTLNHINKLRKMRESKKLDLAQRKKFWAKMYSTPSDDAQPPMF